MSYDLFISRMRDHFYYMRPQSFVKYLIATSVAEETKHCNESARQLVQFIPNKTFSFANRIQTQSVYANLVSFVLSYFCCILRSCRRRSMGGHRYDNIWSAVRRTGKVNSDIKSPAC